MQMSPSLKHVDACLPITALKTFDWDTRNFIFQGQGPHFRVVDDRTGDVCARTRVFRRNNVHGFIILPQRRSEGDREHVQIIIWGGCSLRAVQLARGPGNAVSLSLSSAEFLAPDWIMSGCPAVDDQPDTAYLLTANNAILNLKLAMDANSQHRMKLPIQQLATSVKCLLYSADLIALSASHVLIAAGTVFGEIIVWSCFIDGEGPSQQNGVGSIHHFFTGHEGSIFGVRISPNIPSLNGGKPGRLLASCSDDRTVRVWDISDCDKKSAHDPSPYSTDGFELRSTGFRGTIGEERTVGSEFCLAQAYGHGARIWSVNFRPLRESQVGKIGLVTRGEDSACVVWDLTLDSSSAQTQYRLKEISSIHHHTGKHIWSLDLCARGNETAVYTGGTDGALKCFIVKEDDLSPLSQQGPDMMGRQSKIGTKAFDFVARDCLVGCSQNGEIHVGSVSAGENPGVIWETIHTAKDPRSSLVITGVPRKGLALIGNSYGAVRLYNHKTRSISHLVDLPYRSLVLFALESLVDPEALSFLATYPTDDEATLVKVTGWDGNCPQAEAVTFKLPRSPFEVGSAALANSGKHLLIGSKLGGFAVYRVSNLDTSSQPLLENRRIHGREGTKHIQVVSSVPNANGGSVEYVMTIGRDCYYCLHEVKLGGEGDETVLLETVHRTMSGLGGTLEGAYFDDETGDLMLYGFRSQKFILRNESKLIDIVSIASGGARRGWAFNRKVKGSEAMLSWKEGSHLRTVRIREDLHRALRAGVHGREIRSMDASHIVQGGLRIFATGSEDTTVRIFTLSDSVSASPWGSFECLRVLNTHRSGLQQVTWSRDGKFLFTSAAYEEFFVWRVRYIPSFGIAVVLAAASPKDDPNSELRVTSFDVVEVRESESDNGFLLCLTLSNSTIKIFHFSPSGGACFTPLARGTYMTNCLTQAHFLMGDNSIKLITAATDGYFTLWDLTSTLEPFYTIKSSTLAAKPSLKESSVASEEITCENRYQIHSNSIKALELVPVSELATIIMAGGDDNSISVSLLQTNPGETAQVATVSIPDAHAASVTTLKLLNQQKSAESTSFTVASSGNDHQVKIWLVSVDLTKPGMQCIRIEHLLDRYSSVADISSLGLIKGASEETQESLLVCGVGMELFEAKTQ